MHRCESWIIKKSCYHLVTKSCPSLVTSWTIACQDPPFMGFRRQEYLFPFPSLGGYSWPRGQTCVSCIAGRVLPLSYQGSPNKWSTKNWCFQTVVLEKTLETSSDCKEIKLVNSKGNQLWIFTRKTAAEAEAPILWPPDAKSRLTGNDPDAAKDWKQKKGLVEDEMLR